ncbi:MAG: hypothetical protein IJU86_03940 [Firmicutes bacterium]|nr:hypothetical protein [Bacillota bacterium]
MSESESESEEKAGVTDTDEQKQKTFLAFKTHQIPNLLLFGSAFYLVLL